MSQCSVCAKKVTIVFDEQHPTKASWARELGVSKDSIRRHLEHGEFVETVSTQIPGGESETHKADGSADYVKFSERPWGYDDHRAFIRSQGQDPDAVTFTWGWTSNPAGGFWNKLNNVRPIAGTVEETKYDLPALYSRVITRERVPARNTSKATIVVFADPQIGKVGRRGGTPELLERMAEKRDKLSALLTVRQPTQTALFDGGDGFEGFNSGGNPMFTNDLSLAQQMDCYGTELFELVNTLQPWGHVDIAAVTSNHTAWRNGKQNLGRPADDLGLYVHKQVQKVTNAAQLDTTWHIPLEYDESVAVDILGTSVGMVHGNQFGPGQAIQWWEKQTFGAGAVALADVLLTAHYHTFGAGVAGRNPHSGKQRYWLGAPTLDNGSDWFRQIAGRDSDPGLLVFDIDEDGFDLGSLTIL